MSHEIAEGQDGMHGFNPVRRAQVGLGVAALGSALLILPISNALDILGIVFIAVGTVVGSSFERKSHGWWVTMVIGAILALVSPLVALPTESIGGLTALVGGTLVLVAVVIAFPTGSEAP